MRPDMTERFMEPKNGNKLRFPRNRKKMTKPDEDGYQAAPRGMGRPYGLDFKSGYEEGAGTDYAVVRRFLKSKIGQPWDAVYSEICSGADCRSFKGHHLLQHLEYMVLDNCGMDNGEVIDDRGFRVTHRMSGRGVFFVHPETRTLEFFQGERWRKPKPVQKVFELDGELYHQHEGVWYKVEMKELGYVDRWIYEKINSEAFNAHVEPPLKPGERYRYWSQFTAFEEKYGLSTNGKRWYCVGKKSANSKEIAKLKKKHSCFDTASK